MVQEKILTFAKSQPQVTEEQFLKIVAEFDIERPIITECVNCPAANCFFRDKFGTESMSLFNTDCIWAENEVFNCEQFSDKQWDIIRDLRHSEPVDSDLHTVKYGVSVVTINTNDEKIYPESWTFDTIHEAVQCANTRVWSNEHHTLATVERVVYQLDADAEIGYDITEPVSQIDVYTKRFED